MIYDICPTTDEHIEELAVTMAQPDVDEAWAAGHKRPHEALEYSRKVSRDTTTGLANGEVACIFGVGSSSILTGLGSPWMLTSPILEAHGKVFLRGCRMWMGDQKQKWLKLDNFVDARNERAVKWLRWMGFDLDEPAPYGPDGMDFHKFYWESA
tara:strand:+ start:446 stop:907 length:462 start_codon:yes stop_codon:yes gene_type:complete